mgnify:CR=1 FL=1
MSTLRYWLSDYRVLVALALAATAAVAYFGMDKLGRFGLLLVLLCCVLGVAWLVVWALRRMRARRAAASLEAVVQTQLFLGYVYNRREEENDMKALTSGELGIFIANWIYQRWSQKEQKRLQERNHCIEVSETEPYRGRV